MFSPVKSNNPNTPPQTNEASSLHDLDSLGELGVVPSVDPYLAELVAQLPTKEQPRQVEPRAHFQPWVGQPENEK